MNLEILYFFLEICIYRGEKNKIKKHVFIKFIKLIWNNNKISKYSFSVKTNRSNLATVGEITFTITS